MKIRLIFFLLFFFLLGAAFSNSEELKFKWTFHHQGYLLLEGKVTASTQTSHTDALTGCSDHSSELGCFTQSCIYCTGNDYAIYEVASSTKVDFSLNSPALSIPEAFSTLLGNGQNNLHHRFNTQYILRCQTTTTARNLAYCLLCIFCLPCYIGYELCAAGMAHESETSRRRVRALKKALPTNLPEYILISKRSLSHLATSNNNQPLSSSNAELIDSTHIFDIFLNTPETQQWIIDHLNSATTLTLDIVIPELFNEASSAQVLVQEQPNEHDLEDITPSHFITFNIDNGIRVQYHLYQLSANDFQVLAIVVTFNDYILTLAVNNYNVMTNQPPPHYDEVLTACNCRGACACANFRKKDTDNDTDEEHPSIRSPIFPPPTSY